MGEAQEMQVCTMAAQGDKETNALEDTGFPNQTTIKSRKRYNRWFRIALCVALVLLGQSVATLLGRLYFKKGGKSIWMGTLVQIGGFPILIPYYFILAPKTPIPSTNSIHSKQPSSSILAFVYVPLGLLMALNCYFYSLGLLYLPVSTCSFISSSQLAFNAFFFFYLNSLKFTFLIINSLVLLTILSILLVFQTNSGDSADVSRGQYVIGFTCTIAASAGFGLLLSLTQLAFVKVLRRETFKVVMDMIVYQSLVATSATIVGLFASGEWKDLKTEMEDFEMGKASYLLNVNWTAISWQIYSIGCVGLVFEVSSLFSNAISVLGLNLIPVMAVIFFHDKMHGIKAISTVLALWGFLPYIYQQYLDD